MPRDRLDGSKKKSTFYEIYTAPGRVFLWVQYMFPTKGYASTRQTARHARSPIMTFFYSTGFWLLLAICLINADIRTAIIGTIARLFA